MIRAAGILVPCMIAAMLLWFGISLDRTMIFMQAADRLGAISVIVGIALLAGVAAILYGRKQNSTSIGERTK